MDVNLKYVNDIVSDYLGINFKISTFVYMSDNKKKYLVNIDISRIKNIQSFMNFINYKMSALDLDIKGMMTDKRFTLIINEEDIFKFIGFIDSQKGEKQCGM
jgi:hypothetical protein